MSSLLTGYFVKIYLFRPFLPLLNMWWNVVFSPIAIFKIFISKMKPDFHLCVQRGIHSCWWRSRWVLAWIGNLRMPSCCIAGMLVTEMWMSIRQRWWLITCVHKRLSGLAIGIIIRSSSIRVIIVISFIVKQGVAGIDGKLQKQALNSALFWSRNAIHPEAK